MSNDPTNEYMPANQQSVSNAYGVPESATSMESPAYNITTGVEIQSNGEEGGKHDFQDPVLANSEYNRLLSKGNRTRTLSTLAFYADYHPTFISKPCGDYRYWYDKDSMEPLFIGLQSSNDYLPYSVEFSNKVRDFTRIMDMKNEEERNKYIIWKDVQITAGYKFLSGTWFWEDDKEEISISQFGVSKNLSSGETEISFPGPSLGTLSVDLSQPYFGVQPNLKPSFNAGIFGFEFDAKSKELGISVGLSKGDYGLEVKFVGQVNTDKTSEDAQNYVAYELLPWVGEIKDALGG